VKQYFTFRYWKGQRLLLLVFLLLHVTVSSVYITWQSITFDEKDYYGYCVNWMHGKPERNVPNRVFDSKTPVIAVATIPRVIKQIVSPGYKTTDLGISDLLAGRYAMVIFTLISAVYLFIWIRRLFGSKAWIFPLLFFLFDPLVLGFSMIITSDVATGTCLIATSYHLFAYFRKRSLQQFLFFAIWLSVSLLCKASLLYYLPCLLLICIILLLAKQIRFDLRHFVLHAGLLCFIVLAIMNLAYLGKGSFKALDQSEFKSHSFRQLSTTPVIKDIPVPLPFNYIEGLDILQYQAELGAGHETSTHHGTYLGSNQKYKGGFWYYYLYSGFYKTPIATLFLILAGLLVVFTSLRKQFFSVHFWYVMPFIFFFIILSCFNPFQGGLRHLLLIYPLCFLFIAAAFNFLSKNFGRINLIATGMLVYMLISAALFFPWLISYTNEFIPDKKNVLSKIRDSSIDYGQNAAQLDKFKKEHIGYTSGYPEPKAGNYIVPASNLLNFKNRRNASWLRNFEPIDHYQYSMFIFHISEQDLHSLKQKSRQ
jgi:hypothetical protein